jgi:hypothetical protein
MQINLLEYGSFDQIIILLIKIGKGDGIAQWYSTGLQAG